MLLVNIWFVSAIAIGFASSENNTEVERQDCTCGVSKVARRIVGGSLATLNEYPFQVALIKKSYNPYTRKTTLSQFCGATLISCNWVVTAAHCFVESGYLVSETVLYLADYDLSTTSETTTVCRNATQLVIHPNYNSKTHNHDIALIKMDKPVVFSQYVLPVCIPQSTLNVIGKQVVIIGWGLTSEKGSTSSKLREVSITVSTQQQCITSYGSTITDNMLCAGATGKDSCQGDSGGPMLYKCPTTNSYILSGITSFGNGCARQGYPGVYTNVMKELSFITTTIKGDPLCNKSC